MSGAIGWVDHCKDDVNGAPTLIDNGAFNLLAFDPAYPARNSMTPDVSRVTRVDYERKSTGTQDCELNFEISAQDDAFVRIVAALNVRLPPDVAQVRCFVKNTSSTTLEAGTTYFPADLALIPGTEDRYDLFWVLDETHQCSQVSIVFKFPASSEDYFEIGRAWSGPAVVFPCGVGVDWSLSGVDPSRLYRSEGGGFAAFAYPVRKILNIMKNGLTYDEAMGGYQIDSIRDLILGAGTSSPIVLVSNDDTQHEAQTGSIYGLLQSMPSIDHLGRLKFGTSMRIEQLR